MHEGDICNLGIACPPRFSNRHLADFISETLDENGCAHINFADDKTANQVSSADQTGGTCLTHAVPFVAAGPTPSVTPLPNTSGGSAAPAWTGIALPAAVVLALVLAILPAARRRLRRG
jgi:hypothetical protein